MIRKENMYCTLSYAGIGNISINELKQYGAYNISRKSLSNYDLLIFSISDKNIQFLKNLKTVEDIFYIIENDLHISRKKDLEKIGNIINKNVIFDAINKKNLINKKERIKAVRMFSFVKQDRDRFVHRKHISLQIINAVKLQFPKWKVNDPANIEFWGFYINENLTITLRMTENKFRYRNSKPTQRDGSLRPTIAGAMVYALKPRDYELILDPMCGTGTILKEVKLNNPNTKIIGGDIDKDAIMIANKRLSRFSVNIEKWNAEFLPLENKSINAIICNLPFGKKYSTHEKNKLLYLNLLSEWKNKLVNNGRMILLTGDDKNMVNSLNKLNLNWEIVFKVKVLGLWANVYKIIVN